jgi:pSer/pThr/pTyr-binding forkhead associated (FHA) protein
VEVPLGGAPFRAIGQPLPEGHSTADDGDEPAILRSRALADDPPSRGHPFATPGRRPASPSGIGRALRTAPCPHCGRAIERTLLFCTHCGFRTSFSSSDPVTCLACGNSDLAGDAAFCPNCGVPVRGGLDSPEAVSATRGRGVTPLIRQHSTGPRLAVLDEQGGVVDEIPIDRDELVVGRTAGDLQFSDDDALSDEHAVLTWRDNALRVRDLGSSNGSWIFIISPHHLLDGDLLLVGSQVIRFRLLAPRGADERDSDRPGGSRTSWRDVAMLEQLRTDGTVRDVHYLSSGRSVLIGRDHGDWVFPYDPTMSGRHAEVRADVDDEGDQFTVRDVGSRNGVAVLLRGERAVNPGERLLLGKQVLRVELS